MSIQRMLLVMVAVLGIFGNDAFAIYDTGTGRFIQRDPIGYVDGMNLYAYVASNPMKFVDPLGLELQIVVFQGLGAGSISGKHVKYHLGSTLAGYGTVTYYEQDQVFKAFGEVQNFSSNDTIVIVGYSNGGRSAIQLAEKLADEGIPVELGVTIDPIPKGLELNPISIFFPKTFLDIPDNLVTSEDGGCDKDKPTPWYNFYQQRDPVFRGHKAPGAVNDKLGKEDGVSQLGGHTDIPGSPVIRDLLNKELPGVPTSR